MPSLTDGFDNDSEEECDDYNDLDYPKWLEKEEKSSNINLLTCQSSIKGLQHLLSQSLSNNTIM